MRTREDYENRHNEKEYKISKRKMSMLDFKTNYREREKKKKSKERKKLKQ